MHGTSYYISYYMEIWYGTALFDLTSQFGYNGFIHLYLDCMLIYSIVYLA